MKNTIKALIFSLILAVLGLILPQMAVFARPVETVTDWYIKDFKTTIVVNQDSSLSITEDIVADAGNLSGKHGIFRVLPTRIKTEKGILKTPIELVAITDFGGNPYQYQTIYDNFAKTITWKIGDADWEVQGENNYRITYKVKNAIRFGNPDFDELYWNLLGNFWDLEIDSFSATLVFPSRVTGENASVSYYTGPLGSKSQDLANYQWTRSGTLNFASLSTVKAGEGITASITFPKGIFAPYQPTFWEQYEDQLPYLFLLIPLLVFIIIFRVWQKYGKDPKMKTPIPPEFGVPGNISPMQLGLVLKHGRWDNKFIAASIVSLAVRRYLIIEEIGNKVLFLNFKDYKLTRGENFSDTSGLTPPEKELLTLLLGSEMSVELSKIKKTFATSVPEIQKSAIADVIDNGWIAKSGNIFKIVFILLAAFLTWLVFALSALFGIWFAVSIGLCALILFVFGFFMPKRTQKGVDLLFQIKGFELYMKQAENYRQQFYEKENIFDAFLPYAIVFGITKLWAKKMETIYGKEFYQNYHPVWFVGNMGSFNPDNFASHMNSIVSVISSSSGTSSGAGGGGFSGGGGGGGGGGGW